MPHVLVKMYPGKSDEEKKRLADALAKAITSTLSVGDELVSVAIQDVTPERWAQDVYKPEVLENSKAIYKQPGYNPFK